MSTPVAPPPKKRRKDRPRKKRPFRGNRYTGSLKKGIPPTPLEVPSTSQEVPSTSGLTASSQKIAAQGTSVMLDGTSSEMVLVIQTGGTMDKDYPKREGGYLFEIDTPAAQRVLQRIQPSFPYQLQTVCRKDSQDITQDDRASLADAINQSDAQKVLVTHGTDTIIETASQLAARCPGKTVVLTGSFLPERFKDSDADFNLGFALGALQCLGRRGIFVAMNGRVLPHDAVTRDSQSKNFVEKCRDPV